MLRAAMDQLTRRLVGIGVHCTRLRVAAFYVFINSGWLSLDVFACRFCPVERDSVVHAYTWRHAMQWSSERLQR